LSERTNNNKKINKKKILLNFLINKKKIIAKAVYEISLKKIICVPNIFVKKKPITDVKI
jgi:hypothetical protein